MGSPGIASERARERMLCPGERPLFLADWTDVLFVHFRVDPAALQPHVPFELDLFRGDAYVSLVAFTQRDLRPRLGGRLAARLGRPLATHEFLNVRTYVRCGGECGIFFLAEWIPNRLAALVGPPLYGLPYRVARMRYRPPVRGGAPRRYCGEVSSPAGMLRWRARVGLAVRSGERRPVGSGSEISNLESQIPNRNVPHPNPLPGHRERAKAAGGRTARRGLERFLLERYVAFTRRGATPLRFRVWHAQWRLVAARVRLCDATLLSGTFPWMPDARRATAHYSEGVEGVWIGPPRRLEGAAPGVCVRLLRRASQKLGVFLAAAGARPAASDNSLRRRPSRGLFPTTKEVV